MATKQNLQTQGGVGQDGVSENGASITLGIVWAADNGPMDDLLACIKSLKYLLGESCLTKMPGIDATAQLWRMSPR